MINNIFCKKKTIEWFAKKEKMNLKPIYNLILVEEGFTYLIYFLTEIYFSQNGRATT